LEFQRVYEFLSRLRKEFEPRRAQLLARGRVLISEVLSELRAEETRLCGAGFLEVPYVLLLVVLLRLLHTRLSCSRQLHRFYPLLRVRARVSIRVSTSSIMVRTIVLLATAPTAIGMDTLRPTIIRGIPVCVASTRLVCLLVHQALLQLPLLIRILPVVFVVCSPLQVLLRRALLVL
jgi:hypothetical protein